jgi:radical SAM protein with 4Fe4S-binding SPASM domain
MQVAEYSHFSGLVADRNMGRRRPLEASIEVTNRCPLNCQHCYNNLPMGDSAARKSELSAGEYRRLLDELQKAGVLWLLFTGGEIFGRKDFTEIYKDAKNRGFLVTLFTNGTLITPAIADMLAEYRPFAIEITLYGATKETYEALTQIPGSYDRCMRGIRLLLERKLPLTLKTVPTTINRHEVYEMKRMAEEEFGVEFKWDPLVNPRTDCSSSPLAVRLTPEEAVALEFVDPVRVVDYKRLAATSRAYTDDTVYACGGGISAFAIDPTGRISICVISHQEMYDWRNGTFQDAWDNFLNQTRGKKKTRPTRCDNCQIRALCSMCPANGELEAGDPESPVEFLCQVAHLRAYAQDFAVPEHGDCPNCKGGESYANMKQSASRISTGQIDVGSWRPREKNVLPVLQPNSGCGTSACGSCSSH